MDGKKYARKRRWMKAFFSLFFFRSSAVEVFKIGLEQRYVQNSWYLNGALRKGSNYNQCKSRIGPLRWKSLRIAAHKG